MTAHLKMIPLDLGELTNDPGLALQNEFLATVLNPNPTKHLCTQSMAAWVFDHPKLGPVLYDTGVAPVREEVWPPGMEEYVACTRYDEENKLENALALAGYEPSDIRAIFISHLHLDHAGGLEIFRGSNVPIYAHADEIKSAFYSVATKQDFGPYLPHYLDFSFNWQPLHGDVIEFAEGLTFYRAQGHAQGLLMLHAQLQSAGGFLLVSDEFPVRENFEGRRPQGWVNRDSARWWEAHSFTEILLRRTESQIIYGHDAAQFAELRTESYYD